VPQAQLGTHPLAPLQGRVACLQSLSGTGSLRVGAGFVARFMKGATVYLSNPTWGNHRNIFGDEGVEWKYYRWGGRCRGGWDWSEGDGQQRCHWRRMRVWSGTGDGGARGHGGHGTWGRGALQAAQAGDGPPTRAYLAPLTSRLWLLAPRYYDPATVGLDFAGMVEDLRAAPDGSVVVLHGGGGVLHGGCDSLAGHACCAAGWRAGRRVGVFSLEVTSR
jgi:hypothetical protein